MFGEKLANFNGIITAINERNNYVLSTSDVRSNDLCKEDEQRETAYDAGTGLQNAELTPVMQDRAA